MELDKQPLHYHAADQNSAAQLLSNASKKPKCNGAANQSIIVDLCENSFEPTVGRWGSEWPS
ncbi:hypothetical protein WA026_001789 [Henosepilachna vigintioctopunctata]|uniref:Uncharacterized protein n=1 Tax=Henosepilachna vigintioctopunctata TaxID=420089 RepID=A0AAW1UJ29_9CUCU